MPQFPLGSVLFPSMVLPLHVFEPRYRALIEQVMATDQTFGVVLIERGSEVGGADQRSQFGTTARIVEAEQFSDGRWALITVGVERFSVTRWLLDDPYPQAEIEPWPDHVGPDLELDLGIGDDYARVSTKFSRCMALASEAGYNVGPIPDRSKDIALGCMQMSALAPVGPLDKQRLLGAPGPAQRLPLLDQILDDALELIRLRLTES